MLSGESGIVHVDFDFTNATDKNKWIPTREQGGSQPESPINDASYKDNFGFAPYPDDKTAKDGLEKFEDKLKRDVSFLKAEQDEKSKNTGPVHRHLDYQPWSINDVRQRFFNIRPEGSIFKQGECDERVQKSTMKALSNGLLSSDVKDVDYEKEFCAVVSCGESMY